MFHRIGPGQPVEDWRQLPSSRYFQMAERLPLREGVVARALAAEAGGRESPAAAPQQRVETPPALLAAMSDHPGFPGIEYAGG